MGAMWQCDIDCQQIAPDDAFANIQFYKRLTNTIELR